MEKEKGYKKEFVKRRCNTYAILQNQKKGTVIRAPVQTLIKIGAHGAHVYKLAEIVPSSGLDSARRLTSVRTWDHCLKCKPVIKRTVYLRLRNGVLGASAQ